MESWVYNYIHPAFFVIGFKMRYLLLLMVYFVSTAGYAETYQLFDDNLFTYQESEEEIKTQPQLQALQNPQVENTNLEEVKEQRDIFGYLFGATGLGLSGALGKIFYTWYKSKRGQLFVKNVNSRFDYLLVDIFNELDDKIGKKYSDKSEDIILELKDDIEKMLNEKISRLEKEYDNV